MKLRYYITIVFIYFISFNIEAQSSIELPKAVKAKQDARIEERAKKGKAQYYTIMIFFGGDKDKAYSLKSKFLSKYRDSSNTYPLEIKWEEPYFKVYAGKFESAIAAQKLISELKEWLPNVILVKKEMDYPKL